MTKEKYEGLPPYRKPKVKAAAEQRYRELATAENEAAHGRAATEKAAEEANFKQEAEKRNKVGNFIAQKGNQALLEASLAFLKPYSLILGPLQKEDGGKFKQQYCAVFPSVRFPSIPASERFFFVFDSETDRHPASVAHLAPGTFEVTKPKSTRKNVKFVFRYHCTLGYPL
eukprot:SAG31_NODE_2371_length_5851_cov_4.577886_5_plen_171_part_00